MYKQIEHKYKSYPIRRCGGSGPCHLALPGKSCGEEVKVPAPLQSSLLFVVPSSWRARRRHLEAEFIEVFQGKETSV